MVQLFGFELKRREEPDIENRERSFALPQNDDGALTIQVGSYYGTYVDLDGVVRNEVELITKYRDMAGQPELDSAIQDIVNEAIVMDEKGKCLEINLDELDQSEKIKDKIRNEFLYILKLLNFGNNSQEIFRRWYVDGRLFYHLIIDETSPSKGIQELRWIDPRKIRKIREVQKQKDPRTGLEVVSNVKEYYLFNDRGTTMATTTTMGQKIAVDSVVNVNSGIMDSKMAMVLSYLHKAIRPLNQLRMVEDATVIYRLARAPERRLFYIDVGNMPPQKADQYVRNIMTQYRNKIVYDANTGEVKDQKKYMAMLEDFWLPRREGNKSTEISTLSGGQNLGEIRDVEYFQKKLYTALDIPFSRAANQVAPISQNGQPKIVGLGRTAEIDRDEQRFYKFIQSLRNKFTTMFDEILRVQLTLKGICSIEDWEEFREDIYYEFLKDNNYEEMKEQELLTSRLSLLSVVEPYIGRFYTEEWVRKTILRQTEEEIKEMDAQMKKEREQMQKMQASQTDNMGNPLPMDMNGQPIPQQPQDIQPLSTDQIDQAQANKYAATGQDMFQRR